MPGCPRSRRQRSHRNLACFRRRRIRRSRAIAPAGELAKAQPGSSRAARGSYSAKAFPASHRIPKLPDQSYVAFTRGLPKLALRFAISTVAQPDFSNIFSRSMLHQGSESLKSAPLSGLQSSEAFLRVLHVNDSTDDQVLFQAACRHAKVPFNWHVADSAEKGISYLKTLIEQSTKVPVCWPDLILLDIVMPEATGFEVLKFIRGNSHLRHLPVIMFTGRELPDPRPESKRLGANFCLFKPNDFAEIVDLAKRLYQIILGHQGRGGEIAGL